MFTVSWPAFALPDTLPVAIDPSETQLGVLNFDKRDDEFSGAAAQSSWPRSARSQRLGIRTRYGYHTSLVPDPFTGDPHAPIVVFTLNPGTPTTPRLFAGGYPIVTANSMRNATVSPGNVEIQ